MNPVKSARELSIVDLIKQKKKIRNEIEVRIFEII